ncbi:MAG: hypothetical protein ACYC8T_04270 [Myxococcaceae bacterium]
MTPPSLHRCEQAIARAASTLAELGVLDEDPARLRSLAGRIELLLWKFMQMRGDQAPRFFTSITREQAMEACCGEFQTGTIYVFLSDHQDAPGWVNSITVGLSLMCAAMRHAAAQGEDPRKAGSFTLQHMMEKALESVETLEDLLRIGAPP